MIVEWVYTYIDNALILDIVGWQQWMGRDWTCLSGRMCIILIHRNPKNVLLVRFMSTLELGKTAAA